MQKIRKFNSYLAEKVSRILNKPLAKPKGSDLILTYKCNFACKHCDIWQTKDHQELSLAEWKKIIKDMRQWLGKGYPISLGGGEPLLREDIHHIIKELKDHDFKVTLETNGFLLDENMAKKLAEAGIDQIRLSLYSFSAEVHDELRGIKGAFVQVKKAQQLLKQNNIKTSLGVLVTHKNIGEDILNLMEWANQEDLSVNIQALDENFKGEYDIDWFEQNPLWPQDKEKIITFFHQLKLLKKKKYKIDNSQKTLQAFRDYFLQPNKSIKIKCPNDFKTMNIDPSGKIFFCYKTGITQGDLKSFSAKKMWRSAEFNEKRRLVKKCQKVCRIRCYYTDGLIDKIKDNL